MFHSVKAGRVLFLGNSITLHGPAPAIGWEGNWGMAASAREKDYVHLIVKEIGRFAGKEPAFLATNISQFEREFETYDVHAVLAKELAFHPELVIMAIGDNVPASDVGPPKVRVQGKPDQTAGAGEGQRPSDNRRQDMLLARCGQGRDPGSGMSRRGRGGRRRGPAQQKRGESRPLGTRVLERRGGRPSRRQGHAGHCRLYSGGPAENRSVTSMRPE